MSEKGIARGAVQHHRRYDQYGSVDGWRQLRASVEQETVALEAGVPLRFDGFLPSVYGLPRFRPLILASTQPIVERCHNGTRHQEYIMPSPRKASPAHGAEAEMSSKKKLASPAKAAGKAQGEKSPQMTKQRPKNKSKA